MSRRETDDGGEKSPVGERGTDDGGEKIELASEGRMTAARRGGDKSMRRQKMSVFGRQTETAE